MIKVRIYYTFSEVTSSDEMIMLCASHYAPNKSANLRIIRDKGKKPYFSDSDIYFSVSHTDGVWMCAFADSEVGCDVQYRRKCENYYRLAERWFERNEADKVLSEKDFFDIWSRKEAYAKLIGTGIDENFRRTDTFSLKDTVIHDFSIPKTDDVYSAACACRTEFAADFFDIKNILIIGD